MKRDIDLVRLLLLVTEEAEASFDPRTLDIFSKYSPDVLIYHIKLLESKGLIDIDANSAFGEDYLSCEILGLTWDGADYLDAIRNEKVWEKTKSIVKKTVGSTTMGVIKEAAVMIATKLISQNLT